MNIFIVVLLGLAAIIGIVLIAALFIKREYAVKSNILINRPVGEVFDYVRLLRNQDHYSKWVMTDPEKKIDFKGVDGTVGFIYAWNGNKQAGEGEQEIIGLKPNELVDIEVRFIRPFKSVARTPIKVEPVSEKQTRVIWGMEGTGKYPMNLMNAMISGMLKKDLDISLMNLKSNLEQTDAMQAASTAASAAGH